MRRLSHSIGVPALLVGGMILVASTWWSSGSTAQQSSPYTEPR